MLIALNEKRELCFANKKLLKTRQYYCPSCKERVYLKIGKIMRPHFAHYQNKNCQAYTEGETEEHLTGKLDLATYFKNLNYKVELEPYLNHLNQRPDLLIEKDQKKIAIEFQCSSISLEQIEKRTKGYLSSGYLVIWILGSFFTYRQKLTNMHKASLYYSLKFDNYLLFTYDVVSQTLVIHHNFQIDSYGKMHCIQESLAVIDPSKINLDFQKKLINPRSYRSSISQGHYQLTKNAHYANTKVLDFLSLIYENQENIISIPTEIYQRVSSEWIIQTFHMAWKYRLLKWIESHCVREIITENSLRYWINEKISREEIHFSSIPEINNHVSLTPFYEFLDYLATTGVVKKMANTNRKWSYQKPANRFKYLEDKLI